MKTQIIRMIKKYEKLGSQLLKMDPKPIYAQLIGPKDQKRRWLNDLYQDFFTLMNQYKYPSYLSKEATKRKASKSPNVSVSPRKQKKRKEEEEDEQEDEQDAEKPKTNPLENITSQLSTLKIKE
jgi:hypothetical protein